MKGIQLFANIFILYVTMISLHLFAPEFKFYIMVWKVHMLGVSLMFILKLIYILENIMELKYYD